MTEQSRRNWPILITLVLGVVVIIVLFIEMAKPIISNDIWWHMALGQQFLDTGSLITDHSIFTWSAATSYHPYNSWLADIVLYLIHEVTGIGGLLLLRYAVFFSILLLALHFAVKKGLVNNPFTWVIILVGLTLCWPSFIIKPELFTLGLMTLVIWLYYNLRASGDSGWWLTYLFPIIIIIWVNVHGAFFLSALFFASTIFGELLNYKFNRNQAMTGRLRRHYLFAMLLCVPAMLVNPYGLDLPLGIAMATVTHSSQDYANIGAYQPTFVFNAKPYYMLDYLISAMFVFVVLLWQKMKLRQTDWVVILSFVAFCALFIQIIRTTYFLAPVFIFASLDMLRARERSILWPKKTTAKYAIAIFSGIIIGIISWRVILSEKNVIIDPQRHFKSMKIVRHKFPKVEADYIASNQKGKRVGNLYDDGGYLIHRLWPEKKVMIDPRYFPFRAWIDDYFKFDLDGVDIPGFVSSMDADFWLINYKKIKPLDWFSNSKQWALAFFGPVGAVFVPYNEFNGTTTYSAEVTQLYSVEQLSYVFSAVVILRNIPLAKELRRIAEKNIDDELEYKKQFIKEMDIFVLGTEALVNNDLKSAANLFAKGDYFTFGLELSAKIYRYLASVAWQDGDYSGARQWSVAAYDIQPHKSIPDIYNLALTDWHVRNAENADSAISDEKIDWEEYVDILIELREQVAEEQQFVVDTAIAMKNRTYRGGAKLFQQQEFDRDQANIK
ncbi:MAG: hypothetical protein KZQ92_21520 [Candidatus Thiodiazotropha sp. (ex Lucinoma borealis)]|nr:hypothetical protein [Candidatus Thiodiazotropha sp. (ex Troendleina suluensis)]MCU7866541.1 hypothetical protein [Candidatus Thiodiazotropha sp. (ex Lucinoma borealis)]